MILIVNLQENQKKLNKYNKISHIKFKLLISKLQFKYDTSVPYIFPSHFCLPFFLYVFFSKKTRW